MFNMTLDFCSGLREEKNKICQKKHVFILELFICNERIVQDNRFVNNFMRLTILINYSLINDIICYNSFQKSYSYRKLYNIVLRLY